MDDSLHYADLAVDLDTAGDQLGDLVDLDRFLAENLGGGYDVVLEPDHIHVEFDRAVGTYDSPQLGSAE